MNLKHEQNKFFQILEITTGLVQLNVIFLVTLLPIVTVFPALYALTAVTRQWSIHQDYSVFRSYFHYFKEGLRHHSKLGAVWSLFLLFLLFDMLLIRQIEAGQSILFMGLSLIGFIFFSASSFLFPILTNYEIKKMDAVKLSLFSIFRYAHILVLSVLLYAILCFLVYQSPLFLLFGISLVIFLTTKLYLQQLQRLYPYENL